MTVSHRGPQQPHPSPPPSSSAEQLSFDGLGTPLAETTFVVVDLETTGGSATADAVTEIGAVKVRGGRVIGELATLVDPGRGVPPQIVSLTGITDAMLVDAPRMTTVLPSFLEFATGAVLVAHNAGFDIGFLRAACQRHDLAWPRPPVVCTVKLARRVLTRDEAPSVRLGALAPLLGSATTPTHRALDDARATVDVLHALLERVGNLGVHSLEELLGYLPHVTPEQRRKRTLATHLPHAPGVYLFRGPGEEVLYVGTASDLRRRVRSYFTGAETRRRIREMVAIAVRVDSVTCAHPLEAGVRELRLLAAHRPPYNRRSTQPHKAWWVVLTDEAFPRLSVVRSARDGALGPFRTRNSATEAAGTLAEGCGLRSCTIRIPARSPHAPACSLHEMGRCAAPCAGLQPVSDYTAAAGRFTRVVAGSDTAPLDTLVRRVHRRGASGRYASAAELRDRCTAVILALRRVQRLAAVAAVDELVAARPDGSGGWHFAVVRCGRLAAAGNSARGVPPMPVVAGLVAAAETVEPGPGPLRGAPAEELGLLVSWLERPGTRLVRTSTPWAEAAHGAGGWLDWARRAQRSTDSGPTRPHPREARVG